MTGEFALRISLQSTIVSRRGFWVYLVESRHMLNDRNKQKVGDLEELQMAIESADHFAQ